MDAVPRIRYAPAADGTHLAYQVFGDGPLDLVVVWGTMSHIELMWENAKFARIFRRLGSFSRVIQFDRRGVGLSDRPPGLSTLEERMEDVRTVMDAAGCERAAVFGESEGGPLCALFAATYPERTRALILYGALVRLVADEQFPWAASNDDVDELVQGAIESWGAEDQIAFWAPSMADDPAARQFFARFTRLSSSPGSFKQQFLLNTELDIRPILPSVGVPTLVLHRRDDLVVDVGQARFLAEHIPGARLVEIEGTDHFLIGGDPEPFVDAIEEFLTGARASIETDRVLATIAFTDIVGSTQLAADLGDRKWRSLLDEHDALVRQELQRFNGRAVNTTGDGVLAAFDGPARAIRCAQSITRAVAGLGIDVRAGLHTGECEIRGDDLGGLAVHIASRIGGLAQPREVLVSSTVKDLVAGSGITFAERGSHVLKGVPEEWRLFAAAD
jgi:pimeloyl-ACP methyl ester carboxylesterase